ncbi:MAG: cysteine desulfurase NifS [Bacillota bacterium]|nr:cysteine desulfurase NifS [Bacillota bacterium]
MKYIYMDNAATTKVRPEVVQAMIPMLEDQFANPSSLHSAGQKVKEVLEESRSVIAASMNAKPSEIFFTSGGTEADNLAIQGVMKVFGKGHIITSKIEHHAVLHTVEELEKAGFEATYLDVDEFGRVTPEVLRQAIRPDTKLVTIMLANNEIGTIQDIKALAAVAREHGVLFHTDAVQAYCNIPIDVKDLGIDLMSVSGHKVHAPKGVGALYVRTGVRFAPLSYGGAHERKRRPGTENVASIVGFAKAVEIGIANLNQHVERLTAMREKLIENVLREIPDSRINGDRKMRLPNNAHFCFKYIEGEALLLCLDAAGIAASSGSACTSGSLEPSHVLLSIGLPHEIAHGSVRLTMSDDTEEADIDYVVEKLKEVVYKLRQWSPLTPEGYLK